MIYSQTVAVELEKMNVLYIGVDNPVTIAVENYPCDKTVLQAERGVVKQNSEKCRYTYRIDTCKSYSDRLFVGILDKGWLTWIDTLDYRLKRIPDPAVMVAGHWQGVVKKAEFRNAALMAELMNFDFDCYAKVLRYSYEFRRKDSVIVQETNIKGNAFTERLRTEIENAEKGDIVYFFDIFAELSIDKCTRELQSVKFEIE